MIPKGMTIDMLDVQTMDGGNGVNLLSYNNDLGGSVGQSTSTSSSTSTSNIVPNPYTGGSLPPALGTEPTPIKTPIKSTVSTSPVSTSPVSTIPSGTSPAGTSQVVEPELGLPTNPIVGATSTTPAQNVGAFMGSISGGGAGGGSGAGTTEDVVLNGGKKPFPYWILIVGAVGAYLIFRKK